jgi:hypothetical protein
MSQSNALDPAREGAELINGWIAYKLVVWRTMPNSRLCFSICVYFCCCLLLGQWGGFISWNLKARTVNTNIFQCPSFMHSHSRNDPPKSNSSTLLNSLIWYNLQDAVSLESLLQQHHSWQPEATQEWGKQEGTKNVSSSSAAFFGDGAKRTELV